VVGVGGAGRGASPISPCVVTCPSDSAACSDLPLGSRTTLRARGADRNRKGGSCGRPGRGGAGGQAGAVHARAWRGKGGAGVRVAGQERVRALRPSASIASRLA